MIFLDTGDKIKKLRKELNMKQEELEGTGVSRNFMSMVENGKRKLPKDVAPKLMDIFREKARSLGIKLDVDEAWLLYSAKEQATDYCREKLKAELTSEDIDILADLVKRYKLEKFLTEVYTLKANMLYDNKRYEEAFTYYYETLDYYGKDNEKKAFIYNKLGKCKIVMLNYIEAITYLNKCYEYSTSNREDRNRRNCLYNMALSYRKLGSIDLALDCIEKFINLCDEDKDSKEYMGAIIIKANCLSDDKRNKQAISTLKSVISKFTDTEDILLGYVYNTLGEIYLETNKLDKALECYNKACRIRKLKDIYNFPHTMMSIAKLYIKQKKFDQALELINETIRLIEENRDYEFKIKSYNLLEQIYIADYKPEELKNLYLKIIEVFRETNNTEECLKTYLKLLSLCNDTKETGQYNKYLKQAMGLV